MALEEASGAFLRMGQVCEDMVDTGHQHEMMANVEALFDHYGKDQIRQILDELVKIGFVQKGGDAVAISMENKESELFLLIELDEHRHVHGYELLPFEEIKKKQEKFRW